MRITGRSFAAMVFGVILGVLPSAALAEVVVVVADASPIESLDRTDLRDIYLGRMDRLPSGAPVVPIDQTESAPAYGTFYRNHLGQTPAEVKAHWSKRIFTGRGQPPRSVDDGAAMARTVAGDPKTIGYLEADLVDERLRVVRIE